MGLQRAEYDLSDWTTKTKGRTIETVITRDWRAGGIDYKGETQGDLGAMDTPLPDTHHDCGASILFYTFAKTHRNTRDKMVYLKYIKLKLCKRYKYNIGKNVVQNTGPVFRYPLHSHILSLYIC